MICRAAADDINRAQALQFFIRDAAGGEIYFTVLDDGIDRILYGLRLLMDFLEHKVRISALLGCLGIHGYFHGFLFDLFLIDVVESNLVRFENADFLITDVVYLSRVFQNCRNIGSKESLSLSDTDNHRRVLPRDKNLSRVFLEHDRKRISAAHTHHCMRNRMNRSQIVLAQIELDQIDHNLGVRIGIELISVPEKLLLDILIVLDDAVVYADNRTVIADMRMRVVLGRLSVRSPSGMSDTAAAGHGKAAVRLLAEDFESSLRLYDFKIAAAVPHRQSRGIIPSVFELSKPVQKDGRRLFLSYISDNSAHSFLSSIRNLQTGSLSCLLIYVFPFFEHPVLRGSSSILYSMSDGAVQTPGVFDMPFPDGSL